MRSSRPSAVHFRYPVAGGGSEITSVPLGGTGEVLRRTLACFNGGETAPLKLWVTYQPGRFGPDLVSSGTLSDGLPVYLCRAIVNGGIHPGMTGVWASGCEIGYGGAQKTIADFTVLTDQFRWQRFHGTVPAKAAIAGNEADGRPLHAYRVKTRDGMLAGKYRPGFSGCNIGAQGREITLNPFDLLIE